MKKIIAVLALATGLIVGSVETMVRPNTVKADKINDLAKQNTYSGLTYLYKMLQQEGIPYNCFYADNPLYYRKGKPEGVVIHETATPNASAHDEAIYFNREWMNMYSYVHAFVDHNGVIQMMTPNYGVWGAGPNANNRFFQVELCQENNINDFAKSINNDAIYVAQIMHRYNITPTNAVHDGNGTVWSHSAVSKFLGGTDHGDPDGYFAKWGYSMDSFFDLIKYYYDQLDNIDANTGTGSSNSGAGNAPSDNGNNNTGQTPNDNNDTDNNSTDKVLPKPVGTKILLHDALIYDGNGRATTEPLKKAGVKLTIYGDKIIKGRKFLQIDLNKYVVASNVEGSLRHLTHNAFVYDSNGYRVKVGKLLRGIDLRTYGGAVKIQSSKYYPIGLNQFVKVGNFK